MYDTSAHQSDLLITYGIETRDDDQDIYPPKFCNPCYATLKRDLKARAEGTRYVHTVSPFIWTQHDIDCRVRV